MSSKEVRTVQQDQVLVDSVNENAVDEKLLRNRRRFIFWIVLIILVIIGIRLVMRFTADEPVSYTNIEEHFKYGSIGSEPGGSLTNPVGGLMPPYQVFKVLPAMFPDKLPGGYPSLGFIFEPGRELPIGVSRRYRLGMDQLGLNCSVCHAGTVREAPDGPRTVVLGMPAIGLDLQNFTRFLTDSILDPRFNADNLIAHIEASGEDLSMFDKFLYRTVLVDQIKGTLLRLNGRISRILSDEVPEWGLGRVDTFNPYKSIQFNWNLSQLPLDELIGASDYPSLWWQEPRLNNNMELHWDGNNPSLMERNLSASLGAGVTPVTIDLERLNRVRDWAKTLPPPKYPFEIDADLAANGEKLYAQNCITCHGDHRFSQDGKKVAEAPKLGTVLDIDKIKTDPFRLNSYTGLFAANQYTLYPDSPYSFKNFRKTNGYANQPLDGIWARAPFLHNGSVPTMRDLLDAPEQRPKTFYRGYDVYDKQKLGFVSDVAQADGRAFFYYDTATKGNGNSGHVYGTQLTDEQKDAIVEYMKKF